MTRIFATTALVLSMAAPAFASDQLARSLGVEPGVYSTAQLVELKSAIEGNNDQQVQFILDSAGTDGFTASTMSAPSAGKAQIAADLGVNPADYSLGELVKLRKAEEESNEQIAGFVRSNGLSETVSSKSGISAGQAQLAASLGVNPADYTLAELSKMASDAYDDSVLD